MTTLLQRVHSTPGILTRLPQKPQKPLKISEVLIHRICTAYPPEEARRAGISYWPEPLPAPDQQLLPDPLVLFPSAELGDQRQALVPLRIEDLLARRNPQPPRPSLQVPLGLIDHPELQQRDTLLVDLHGKQLEGGPLLIIGSQYSGKSTALQTLLLWFAVRYRPAQFRCAVIDPDHDLQAFQCLPHLQDFAGQSLWTDASSDEQLAKVLASYQRLLLQRRSQESHWREDTLARHWAQGTQMPLLFLMISNYQRFLQRPQALMALQELASMVSESRELGAYLVLTSTELGVPSLSAFSLMHQVANRLFLYLHPTQRLALLGEERSMDPIPGRGLLLTHERQMHEVQLALPTSGATESEREQQLAYAIECCKNSY